MDIGSNSNGVASRLSNFTARSFIFDGVACSSIEGVLQAFKYENFDTQKEVCKLIGIKAKRKGQKRNKYWKTKQVLWWNNKPYQRKSKEYAELLTKLYDAVATNEKFCKDLKASQNAVFTHAIGNNKKSETVLTASEFCKQLHRIRFDLIGK